MESYDRVAKVVAPKKALLAKSEGDLKIVLSELGEKKGTKERASRMEHCSCRHSDFY